MKQLIFASTYVLFHQFTIAVAETHKEHLDHEPGHLQHPALHLHHARLHAGPDTQLLATRSLSGLYPPACKVIRSTCLQSD